MPSFGGAPIPVCCFGIVGRHRPALRVKVADQCCRFWFPREGRTPQPRFTGNAVLLDILAVQKLEAPSNLGRAMPLLSCIAVKMSSGYRIASDATALLGEEREHISRSRQLGIS